MKCKEARELFSSWMDHEIAFPEQGNLQKHLEACAACRLELREWEAIALVLRASKDQEITAPPGLCSAVMHNLRAEKKARRFAAWKKTGAGIAAALALYLGSRALALSPAWQVAEQNQPVLEQSATVQEPALTENTVASPPVAIMDVSNIAIDKENDAASEANAASEASAQANVSALSASDPLINETVDPAPENAAGLSETVNLAVTPTATADSSQELVFLSRERTLVSTFMILSVENQDSAQQQALNIAHNCGALVQPLGREKDGDKEAVAMKMTVSASQADALKSSLAALGSPLSRQENSQSLDDVFSETLEEYRALHAKVALMPEGEEKDRWLIQLQAMETQLQSWENESLKQSVVLWLEN